MITELTLMIATGVVIISLFVIKYVKTSKGALTSMLPVMEKTDPILKDIKHKTGTFVSYITLHNFVLLINYIFVHTVRLFMHTSRKMHDVSSDIVEKASKRTEDLSKRGAASFYLKQIKDAREGNVGTGEIVDVMDVPAEDPRGESTE